MLFRQKHCSIYSNFDYCILFLLCKYQIKFSSVENIFHDLINSLDCKLFPSLYSHIDTEFSKYIYIQCVPRKGFGEFGSAVCAQRDRNIVYIVSLSADLADPNPFRDTHSIISVDQYPAYGSHATGLCTLETRLPYKSPTNTEYVALFEN